MAPGALQTEPSKDTEVGFATESAPWQRAAFDGDNSLKRKVLAAAAATFGILLLVLLCSSILVVIVKTQEAGQADAAASCLLPLGGGSTPSGNFPVDLNGCKKALKHYMSHQYVYDVETAVNSASAWFSSNYPNGATTKDLIVFDIDETVLSNFNDLMRQLDTGKRNSDDQDAGLDPAIPAMLKLYSDLFTAGFSVTFLTGRRNASRAASEQNLYSAGYGEQCPEGAPDETRSQDLEPCYVQLDMREENDTRIASIYKPDRRKRLQDRGFEIVACFGDQWSDLAGTTPGLASFKLPNPMYYIL